MTIEVKRTKMNVTNVNPRKEGKGDGMRLASDVSVRFTAQRKFMDQVIPLQEGRFSSQFFADDGSTRLNQVYPIVFNKKITDLRVSVWLGTKPMVFEGAKIKDSMNMTPEDGGYLEVTAVLQLNPTTDQSGKLDDMTKEWIEMEIESLNADVEDDARAEAAVG